MVANIDDKTFNIDNSGEFVLHYNIGWATELWLLKCLLSAYHHSQLSVNDMPTKFTKQLIIISWSSCNSQYLRLAKLLVSKLAC